MTDQIRTVTLENLEPRLVCYNLDHKHGVERLMPRIKSLPNDELYGDFEKVSLPDSLTFLAKERRSVPASVLECDEIRTAIDPPNGGPQRLRQRGDVVVTDASPPEEIPAQADSAPAVVNSAQKRQRDAARTVIGSNASVDENNKG